MADWLEHLEQPFVDEYAIPKHGVYVCHAYVDVRL